MKLKIKRKLGILKHKAILVSSKLDESIFKKIILLGFFTFLFGCNKKEIKEEALYGKWMAINLNNQPIQSHGFTSIILTLSHDSIEIITEIKTIGSMTTVSNGIWSYKDGIFKSKIGDNFIKSKITISKSSLIFSPDPLFLKEAVLNSEYRKIK